MRKILSIAAALTLLTLMAGCGMMTPTPTPRPSAVLSTPMVTMQPSMAPDESALPDTSALPDNSALPGATPGGTPGDDPAAMSGTTITDFSEGKEVTEADAPAAVNAVKREYPGATIKGITHAMHENRQMYRVQLEGADVSEVYVDAAGVVAK